MKKKFNVLFFASLLLCTSISASQKDDEKLPGRWNQIKRNAVVLTALGPIVASYFLYIGADKYGPLSGSAIERGWPVYGDDTRFSLSGSSLFGGLLGTTTGMAAQWYRHRKDDISWKLLLQKMLQGGGVGFAGGALAGGAFHYARPHLKEFRRKYITTRYGKFSVEKPLEQYNRKTSIALLRDENGNKFILKVERYQMPDPAKDALGSFVAESVGIDRINKVRVIGSNESFPEKPEGFVATLHEKIPGKPLAMIKIDYRKRFGSWSSVIHDEKNFTKSVREFVRLRENEKIVTFDHFTNQSKFVKKYFINNEGIQEMGALDVFLNNYDRNLENIFYDQQADQFYGIDMGDIFDKDYISRDLYLADGALDYAREHIFTNPEKLAESKTFFTTLDKLVKQFTPKKTINLWMDYAEKAEVDYSAQEKQEIFGAISRAYEGNKQLLEEYQQVISPSKIIESPKTGFWDKLWR